MGRGYARPIRSRCPTDAGRCYHLRAPFLNVRCMQLYGGNTWQTKPRRIICAFQPHRYSRTKLLANEFGGAFREADILVLTDVYAAGETPLPGISGRTILDAVRAATGQDVTYIPAREAVAAHLAALAQPGDIILTMGAGDIWKTGEELVALLEERETKQ